MNPRELKARFGLTLRETDVLRDLLKGMANADIAVSLNITEQTVKDHLSRVYKKTGVKNRFELLRSLAVKSYKKGSQVLVKVAGTMPSGGPLSNVSYTDELTGLYNRKGFLILMGQQIKLARRQKNDFYVLHAKVHNLNKKIPDDGGDKQDFVLLEAADVLKDTFRESDIIARIGGKEFAVIPLGTFANNSARMVDRLKENIDSFNSINSLQHALSISYKVSCWPSTANDLPICAEWARNRQRKSRSR